MTWLIVFVLNKQVLDSHSEAEAWLQRWSEVACSLLCFITGNIGLLAFPVKLGTLQTSYFCICREIFFLSFHFFETISSYTSHVGLALTSLHLRFPGAGTAGMRHNTSLPLFKSHFICVFGWVCIAPCAHGSSQRSEEGVRSLGSGIKGDCETPWGAGNWTWVACKSDKCS